MYRIACIVATVTLAAACAGDAAGPQEYTTSQPPAASVAQSVSVVMSGLNSPRGLDWGPEGALYVVEAGTSALNGACTTFMEGAMLATKCWSGTGSVSRLWRGRQERVAEDMPSTYITQSNFASGPQAISFAGGRAFVTLGWGGHPSLRSDLGGAAAASGTLVQLEPSGQWQVLADISAFETSHNPDGGIVDSNPYGVLAEPDVRYVVDAGGNSLLQIAANGTIETIATFPRTPVIPPFNQAEAVPTRVRRGPDGALYVSTLSGVPFMAGSAAIYRVRPGQQPDMYAGGFKTITDFVFTPDGGMYVLQFATGFLFFNAPGALIRVARDGTRSVIIGDLEHPTGLALGSDGSIYLSNRGTSSGNGEVLRIVP